MTPIVLSLVEGQRRKAGRDYRVGARLPIPNGIDGANNADTPSHARNLRGRGRSFACSPNRNTLRIEA